MIESDRNTVVRELAGSLFEDRGLAGPAYNEAFSSPSEPRPHWRGLLSALESRGPEVLHKDNERARRMRHEDGATINLFDDPGRRCTSWDLDIIPLPISAAEWSVIESGLIQRAHLLEKIVADTYGPQQLLKEGLLPAELIHANPNFLHSCHNVEPRGGRFLSFYAADLYRAEDGSFKVFRDYASCPAGLGYALENRIVMSRIFSALYHETQILRLAPFFQFFKRAISARASLGKEEPGIVLLSPGPASHIYFEHALLSRYLGYPLVESQDLTVRNGKVFLKKLVGLEPVEAIVRHLPDRDSDPFALRRQTETGVAGLIQVCREQNIEIVNPVGSGFVDTPVLPVFLPSLSKRLLGEELRLQNHPAWWCGDRQQQTAAGADISLLRLDSAFSRQHEIDGTDDPLALINASPADYMLSAPIRPATAPAWGNDGVYSSYNMMRLFVCATANGFSVMPGGLAVSSADRETLVGASPEQQQSKDIWVISDRPVEAFSLMKEHRSTGSFIRSSDLPSRVADHLLWLGRYLERAERLVALMRSIFRRISGEDRPEDIPELMFLLTILEKQNIINRKQGSNPETLHRQELLAHLNSALYGRDRVDSVVSILDQVRKAARKVRDRLSTDSSRIINHLEDLADSPPNYPLEFLDETLFSLSAFSGLAMESMTRSLGWRFMDMGRRVERAINQAKLINSALPHICSNAPDTLEALLEVSDSVMTYRQRYRSSFQLAAVIDLLVADENNPKSLAFQLSRIATHVENLPRQGELRYTHPEERIALKMLTEVRLLELSPIGCGEDHTQNEMLKAFLEKMLEYLKHFSQEVTGHYLTRIPATPHFAMIYGDQA